MPRILRPFVGAPVNPPTVAQAQQVRDPASRVQRALAGAASLAQRAQGIYQAGSFPALLGYPGWRYVSVQTSPRLGPTPRLAQGSGQTGGPDNRSDGTQYGGYLSDSAYFPAPLDYSPETSGNFRAVIPPSVGLGVNGRELMGTYQPHDFTPARYEQHQRRSAENWQVMSYPANWRNLLGAQQAAKYNLYNQVALARPLAQNDYFLGYQMTLSDAASLGVTGMGRPLGS